MPNSATSEYHYAFVKVSKFEEWGEELAIFNLLRDNAPICGDDFWQLDIAYFEEGVDYYCYGIGYNAEAELGEPTYVRFNLEEGVINVDEVAAESYSIFPNPAKDFVKVSTDNRQQTTVRIYNTVGMLVEEVEMNSEEIEINVSDYKSGIYFINVNGKVEKLVVE